MKVKRFYIIFLSILLMLTTTLCSMADSCYTSYIVGGESCIPIIREFSDKSLYYGKVTWFLSEYDAYYCSINGYTSFTTTQKLTLLYFTSDTTHGIGYLNSNGTFATICYGTNSNDLVLKYNPGAIGDSERHFFEHLGISYIEDGSFLIATSIFNLCILDERSPEFMAVITAILSVFTAIGDWFVEIIPTVLTVFWTPAVDGGEGSLTIIGALAVASLAIAVILLILRWIVEFFRFRG